jgi:hypothetical protein
MGVTLLHPFRIRFGVEATRDSEYRATVRTVDLVELVSAPIDGFGRKEFSMVSEVRCLPGDKAEIECICDRDKPVEKVFGELVLELEKHGWKVTGL